jgi:hypothetical protein
MERYQDLVGARLMGYKFSDADVQWAKDHKWLTTHKV